MDARSEIREFLSSLRARITPDAAGVRAGGTVSRVGAPQYATVPADFAWFLRNITVTGGVAPARRYTPELLPDVLECRIGPGRVFDRTVDIDDIPSGCRATADRAALKVLVQL